MGVRIIKATHILLSIQHNASHPFTTNNATFICTFNGICGIASYLCKIAEIIYNKLKTKKQSIKFRK